MYFVLKSGSTIQAGFGCGGSARGLGCVDSAEVVRAVLSLRFGEVEGVVVAVVVAVGMMVLEEDLVRGPAGRRPRFLTTTAGFLLIVRRGFGRAAVVGAGGLGDALMKEEACDEGCREAGLCGAAAGEGFRVATGDGDWRAIVGGGGDGGACGKAWRMEVVRSECGGNFERYVSQRPLSCRVFGMGLGGGVGGHSISSDGGGSCADSEGDGCCRRWTLRYSISSELRRVHRGGTTSSFCIRMNMSDTDRPESARPVRSLPHIRQNTFSKRRPLSTISLFTEYTVKNQCMFTAITAG